VMTINQRVLRKANDDVALCPWCSRSAADPGCTFIEHADSQQEATSARKCDTRVYHQSNTPF